MSNITNTTTKSCEYYGCYLEKFRIVYGKVAVPVGLLVCLFGIVANTLNIIVLGQRRLRKSPTNILLTALSLAQLLLLTGFVILSVFNQFQDSCVHFSWTYSGAVLKLVLVSVNNVCHTTAFAITLYLALLRVIAVRWPFSAHRIMSRRAVVKASLLMLIAVILLCSPAYLSSIPAPAYYHPNCTEAWASYEHNDDYYDLAYNEQLAQISFLLFGVILKLLPCAIMIILISLLIVSLRKVENRRRRLTLSHVSTRSTSVNHPPRRPRFGRSKTTKMLVAVLLVCVSIELPHGLLHLCSALKGEFAENVYDNLGDFIEMLTLLYSSINFIIYCSMSSDFLITFRILFLRYKVKRLASKSIESYTFHQIYSDRRRNRIRLKGNNHEPLHPQHNFHDQRWNSDVM